jgi:hypothetical protein
MSRGAQVAETVVVVTAMPLSAGARAELSAMLGPGYTVVDIKAAPSTANIVLTPVVSGQLLGALRGTFPEARILYTELHDDARGISFTGPLTRVVEKGPDGYFVAHDLDALSPVVQAEARLQLGGATRGTPLTLSSTPGDPEPDPSPDSQAPEGPATVHWLDSSTAHAPAGRRLDLDRIDALVANVTGTGQPRRDLLWPAVVAECVVRLAEEGEHVLVDVTGLEPAIRAELEVRVAGRTRSAHE